MKAVKYIIPITLGLCLAGLVIYYLLASLEREQGIWMVEIPQTGEHTPAPENTPHKSAPLMSERERRIEGQLEMSDPDRFAEFHRSIRTRRGETAPAYPPNYRMDELQKAWRRSGKGSVGKKAAAVAPLDWKERGPSNVAGRARTVLVDPDDPMHDTWYVGSASGGVWKTEDAGRSWRELTRDLPNLATTTLAMPASNPDVIFAGTGEGYGSFAFVYGQGIWKSEDKGETWTQLAATAGSPAFTNVLRLIVNPVEENQLIAATSTGVRNALGETSYIMRSSDGGVSWDVVHSSPARVEQVIANPENFQVQYAAVNGKGIMKSTDGGATWIEIFDPFFQVGRVEMAIAPTDPSRLYAASEGGFFDATLFFSSDAGETWEVIDNAGEDLPNWLGDLGWYSNALAVDPFDPDRVYVGGVDIFRFDVGSTSFLQGFIEELILTDPQNFMEIAFVLEAPVIAPKVGRVPGITSEEFLEIEIRWGPDKKQKAHRFEGKWLLDYKDYVDVEFEVWDVTNDRQLMVAFEDENKDGRWDFFGALSDASERTLLLDADYSETTPHFPTTQNAFSRAMYVMKVVNEKEEEQIHGPFPEAILRVVPEISVRREAGILQVTDGYGENLAATKGVHVDHHQLLFVKDEDVSKTPILLDANDGGVAVSFDLGATFMQTGDTFSQLLGGAGSSKPLRGLNTAQFYGVDKMNGADRFVGGTQDNGSWVSPALSTNNEPWRLGQGGDGFDAVWHYENPDWIIQSAQFGRLFRSVDRGQSWRDVSLGGTTVFLTRIAKSNQDPDLLFIPTPNGATRSTDFGLTWQRNDFAGLWREDTNPTVRISLATPDVVWAAAEVGGATPVYVSVDGGLSFESVQTGLPDLGAITNIATHPFEPETAYMLLSMADAPKIYKTPDLGETWEELSGFGAGSESSNGFPDVATYSLLVMPFDDQLLWAGTEIGIFGSTDGGANWHFSESGFPAVAVWEMRIVNDQVVVGTHGRGVWTVQLPELAAYEPANMALGPFVKDVRGGADGRMVLDVDLRSVYDSTWIMVDGRLASRLSANVEKGVQEVFLELGASGNETVRVSAQGYATGQVWPSPLRDVDIFPLEPVAKSYFTEFESSSEDFVLDGFSVDLAGGFSTAALHSVHPYADFTEATALLRTPIGIAENNHLISFDEIALVEAGDDGAAFGSDVFFDYAIVEGSIDGGITWQPLEDGYDVRRSDMWDGSRLSEAPSAAQFVRHVIDLSDSYGEGEEVLFRFRLSSDNAVTGWGWVIDNLCIQCSTSTSSSGGEDLPARYALLPGYPNPFSSEAAITYTLPEPARVRLAVFDASGRMVQQLVNAQRQPAGVYRIQWDGITLWGGPAASGVYFLRLEAGDGFRETRQLIKVR